MNIIVLLKSKIMHKEHNEMTKNIKHKQDANFKGFDLEAQKLKKYLKIIEYIVNSHNAHHIKKSNAQKFKCPHIYVINGKDCSI